MPDIKNLKNEKVYFLISVLETNPRYQFYPNSCNTLDFVVVLFRLLIVNIIR